MSQCAAVMPQFSTKGFSRTLYLKNGRSSLATAGLLVIDSTRRT